MLYETGGVPFEILEPVLERCTPEQLLRIEEYNPVRVRLKGRFAWEQLALVQILLEKHYLLLIFKLSFVRIFSKPFLGN